MNLPLTLSKVESAALERFEHCTLHQLINKKQFSFCNFFLL